MEIETHNKGGFLHLNRCGSRSEAIVVVWSVIFLQ